MRPRTHRARASRSASWLSGCALVLSLLPACGKNGEPGKPNADPKTASSGAALSGASGAVASDSSSAAPLVIVGKRVDIDVGEHGFIPSEIHVTKGEPTTLVFTRTSNSTCARDVVFEELGVDQPLHMNKPTPVVMPVDKERTLTFTCGMKMYKSSVIIQ